MEDFKRTIIDFITRYAFQVLGAIIILGAGIMVARWIGRVVQAQLDRLDLEPPIRRLLVNVVQVIVMAFTLVIAMGQAGVPIAPLVAGIGVVGVGIGLGLQGVLSNAVSGLLIIFTKPFRVGEYIDLLGVNGQVTSILLFSTTLVHADRSRVVIPNRKIVGEILHNYGAIRQLDLTVGVAYDTPLKPMLATVQAILAQNARVLKDPAPVVGISALGDSSINVAIKPWVAVADCVLAQAELYQAIIEQFQAQGIQMPYPQQEVRLITKPG
jgi:small conductance mechanosensitive channel